MKSEKAGGSESGTKDNLFSPNRQRSVSSNPMRCNPSLISQLSFPARLVLLPERRSAIHSSAVEFPTWIYQQAIFRRFRTPSVVCVCKLCKASSCSGRGFCTGQGNIECRHVRKMAESSSSSLKSKRSIHVKRLTMSRTPIPRPVCPGWGTLRGR